MPMGFITNQDDKVDSKQHRQDKQVYLFSTRNNNLVENMCIFHNPMFILYSEFRQQFLKFQFTQTVNKFLLQLQEKSIYCFYFFFAFIYYQFILAYQSLFTFHLSILLQQIISSTLNKNQKIQQFNFIQIQQIYIYKTNKLLTVLKKINIFIMSRKQFTLLTSQGKQSLFNNTQKKPPIVQSSLSDKENKFLQHFRSINNIDPIFSLYNTKASYNNQNFQTLYMSKMESYAQSNISQIQRILRANQDINIIKPIKSDYKIQKTVPIIYAKSDIRKNIQKINNFFNFQSKQLTQTQKQMSQQIFKAQILQIGVYSQLIKNLQFKKLYSAKPDQFPASIYNSPTQRPFHYNDFNTNQTLSQQQNFFNTNNPSYQTQRNFNFSSSQQNQFTNISLLNQPTSQSNQPQIKIRKADMLLVQILRQKKRKGLVSDYYKIMQLKLFELLDYILQDQKQFQGMASIDKMKQVLKRLDSFKGKKIQGESKINLLKIFFEQFRNLKNEIGQNQKKKPLQRVQNKVKQSNKQGVTKQVQELERKEQGRQREFENKNIKGNGRKDEKNKWQAVNDGKGKWGKKTMEKDAMSVANGKEGRNARVDKREELGKKNKSVKGEDQWLGELQ